MSLFKRKHAPAQPAYDPEVLTPVIRASICTGEQTAGFKENETGRFREVMLIQDDADLQEFREKFGIQGEIKTIY